MEPQVLKRLAKQALRKGDCGGKGGQLSVFLMWLVVPRAYGSLVLQVPGVGRRWHHAPSNTVPWWKSTAPQVPLF